IAISALPAQAAKRMLHTLAPDDSVATKPAVPARMIARRSAAPVGQKPAASSDDERVCGPTGDHPGNRRLRG
ncbi:MAG: hypothetical protein ACLP22_16750, partial [Solirubrobacteraceae bacterium]